MAPPTGPGLSAPDLVGPTSFLDWPTQGPSSKRRRKARPYAQLRLEIDLHPEIVREPSVRVFERLEALLQEREVVEVGDLLRLTARVLHAFSAVGFGRVDHWAVEPGGWLPLPEGSHDRPEEPVGHLLRALEDPAWSGLGGRRSFALRLSGRIPYRADVVVRRLHRERRHALTVELRGKVPHDDVRRIVAALAERVPLVRAHVTQFVYA